MELEKLNDLLKKHDLELVIGLETHVRLNTKSKLFCSCANTETEQPNNNICSVCTGQMGVLPSINAAAITKAIYFGKAVKSTFENEVISWDRKHYEYPDNPKNIQITQFHNPVIPDGEVSCFRNDGSQFTVNLTQVHIEEDAAKLMHEKKVSLVDFNKAGVPLIEIVTEPCIRHIEDASTYAQYIQRIVQNLKISEANLEKGEFKSDVSVSLRKKHTYNLNPRTEIKNLNSFKFMVDALKEEIEKQLNYYIENKEFRPDQTTVLWDADLKQTKTMRKKEFEADYRFISEPDLPFVSIKSVVESIDVDISSLPFAVESILIKGNVLPQDAKFFTADSLRSETFVAINNAIKDPSFVAKTLVNNIGADEYKDIHDVNHLIEIFQLFKAEKITAVLVQNAIIRYLKDRKFDYNKYFEENTISEEKIKLAVIKVIAENEAIANDIKAGNQGKAGILVGKVIGIIGLGRIGRKVAEMFRALGNPVIGFDLYPNEEWATANGVEVMGMEAVLGKADIVSLHIPGNSDGSPAFGKTHLGLMKESALLINLARGGVVDEESLYSALKNNEIKGRARIEFGYPSNKNKVPFEYKIIETIPFVDTNLTKREYQELDIFIRDAFYEIMLNKYEDIERVNGQQLDLF